MSILKRTKARIAKSRSGAVNCIPTGIKKFDEFTDGVTQGTYFLIAAETSVGKTAFVRDKFLHTVYEHYKSINDPTKLDVLFLDFTLEITPEMGLAGAMSRKIYFDYGKIAPAKKILGSLSDEGNALINSMDEYFEEFQSKCIVFEEDITPSKYHDILMKVALANGKFDKQSNIISESGNYTPNNPNLYTIILFDTINLAEIDSDNATIKATIDRISRISVWFRNKCNFTPIIVQQLNAELSSVERKRFAVTTPKLTDVEDSKRPGKDCDVAFFLYDPTRHLKDEETIFRGYDMEKLKGWYRSGHLLKNRRGENNKIIHMKFGGAVGLYQELLPTEEMDEEQYKLATKY